MAPHSVSRPKYFFLLPVLVALAGCLLLSACGDTPEARQIRVLQQANESLRQQLSDNNEALARVTAELMAQKTLVEELKATPPPAPTIVAAPEPEPPPVEKPVEAPKEDTSYIVVSKSHTPGRLNPQPSASDPSASTRVPAVFEVIFRGAQSAKTYPALEVTQLAFPQFREGQSYSRAELNAAKLVQAGQPGTTSGATGGANSGLPPLDFDEIFGIK